MRSADHHMGLRELPYCLHCGYARDGLEATNACPECGNVPDPMAPSRVREALQHPVRRAWRLLLLRKCVDGWWCLLPASLQLQARVQLVTGLTLATFALLLHFAAGAHVRAIVALRPAVPASGTESEIATAQTAILGGVIRGDLSYRQTPWATSHMVVFPRGSPPTIPHFELLRPSWSPVVIAGIVWCSCTPAAGLLGLRFVFLPLTIRSMRRSMTNETRAAAAVAADATVASAGLATALLVIATAIGLFLAAISLPDRMSAGVIVATPTVLLTMLITAPPMFVARAAQCDGARRVFARPTLAAVVIFISYFAGLGIAAALISATFVIASGIFT